MCGTSSACRSSAGVPCCSAAARCVGSFTVSGGSGDSTVTVFRHARRCGGCPQLRMQPGTATTPPIAAGEFVRSDLSSTGKIAVVSGIVVCLAVSVLNNFEICQKQEAK